FDHLASIKDMVESLNVPHPEVDVIVANGASVDFNYLVRDSDTFQVYPHDLTPPLVSLIRLYPPPLEEARFILDTHLGKLATYLRMLGFDTLYSNRYEDDVLAEVSFAEKRILLTRDLGVLKRGIVEYGYFVRSTHPERQLFEILKRYNLTQMLVPFKRCMTCNGPLEPIDKETISERLMPSTRVYYNEFYLCSHCDKIYWKGSHHERMKTFIQNALNIQID
ncbi:MAG: Mut7-C ubiquitin/RNAse domain-containing protein, partial [Anaerolineae bacterium]|nr:Mut7-C ubiquitin/RNAse domain-containing protein [Anaerolineae bacterium]